MKKRMIKRVDLRAQIKDRMNAKGINIPHLARLIGCNEQTLYDFFGPKQVSLGANYLEAILNILNGKLSWRK